MKIDFTKEEILIIRGLCDVGLKIGGIENLPAVTKILTKINMSGFVDDNIQEQPDLQENTSEFQAVAKSKGKQK